MAPTPATAAGTADPTARNLEATATPHDSPSVERATIENVMAATLAGPPRRSRRRVSAVTRPGDRAAGSRHARPWPASRLDQRQDEVARWGSADQARLPGRGGAPQVRDGDRHRRRRVRRVDAGVD